MPVVTALRKLTQEDREFEASLRSIERTGIKANNKNKQNQTK
jgi:hypothetical protein